MELLHTFRFKNYELNLYDHENFDNFLFELKINGSSNAVGFSDNFDPVSVNCNEAVVRFHKLTSDVYKDELSTFKKLLK